MNKSEITEILKYAGADETVFTEIDNLLKAYDEVCVTRINGKFDVSASIAIDCVKKGDTYKSWWVQADVWYNTDERIENYVNEFLCYPDFYNGRVSYLKLAAVKKDIRAGKVVAKMVNGNIEFKAVA